MEQELLINEFYKHYDKLIKIITTKNKVKFNSTDTALMLNESLKFLVKLEKNDLIRDVDNYMVYNIFLFTKAYLKINYKQPVLIFRKAIIIDIKKNLEILNSLNIKQENFRSVH